MASHSSASELQRYVRGELSVEDCAVVQGHLDECEACQLALANASVEEPWQGAERRREQRIPVKFKARLKLLDPVTSGSPPHDVVVVEISRGGMKISTPRYLIPKTLVQIRFNGKAVLGEVRYCVKKDTRYFVGIQKVPDFPSK